MKITFTGDIMIEPPVLKAARQKDGSFDFYPIFAPAQKLLSEADLLIGNLETPLAGEAAGYTDDYYCFNAPDSYADAIKKAGFHMVSTANNHTLDRGFDGAERTIQVLDEKGIGHHGSFLLGTPRSEAWYTEVSGTKIAVVAYTYGTNYGDSGKHFWAEGDKRGTVNLLRPQTETVYQPGVYRDPDWVDKVFKFLDDEKRGRIKKHLPGLVHNYPRADDRLDKKTMAPYVEMFMSDLRKAKENADVVIFYPHMGGQFNPRPGAISEYVMDKGLEVGADAILASHAHMVQKAELRDGVPCAYSMGNFNMDPDSSLMVHEYLPDYGLAVHLYVEDKKIVKTTFSILKAVRKKKGQICAWPVDELYPTLNKKEQELLLQDVRQMVKTVTGAEPDGEIICREYPIF